MSLRITELSVDLQKNSILKHINLEINTGEFISLLGASGCGKTTLLKSIAGLLDVKEGDIQINGKSIMKQPPEKRGTVIVFQDLRLFPHMTVEQNIGFTMDIKKVSKEIKKKRVAELLHAVQLEGFEKRKIREMSGGQKQILNLAAIMAMHPSLLILDEPTSQLDPIAASDFLETVKKINRDIGTTVLLTEHRLQDIIPYADRVFVMDKGNVYLEGTPREIGVKLKEQKHGMFLSMPIPMQIYGETDSQATCPLTVSEGRQWLSRYCNEKGIASDSQRKSESTEKVRYTKTDSSKKELSIQAKDVWFRYEKDSPDVVRDLSLEVKKGEFYALVGGNGTGKSTTLSLLSRVHQPYRGKILLEGRDIRSYKDRDLYCGLLGVMPQNPQSIFLKKTVLEDLYSVIGGRREKMSSEYQIHMKKEKAIEGIVSLTRLEGLLERHPYDLSGGEQQRLALAKVLLLRPRILLMDEPTKGMDAEYKEEIGKILTRLKQHGLTIFMISHDVEFVAEYADRVGLFFEGNIVTSQNTREFFAGNNFYTTAANRMARHLFPEAVTGKDVVTCLQSSNWTSL